MRRRPMNVPFATATASTRHWNSRTPFCTKTCASRNTMVVSEWFPEVAARQRTAFCLKLLPVCEEAFEMYDLTDDFESSPSYKNLLLELTGLIQTHIELHGIQ